MWVRLNGPDFPIMFPISIAIAVLADSGTLGLGVALGLADTADGVALDCTTSFGVVRGLAALVFSLLSVDRLRQSYGVGPPAFA